MGVTRLSGPSVFGKGEGNKKCTVHLMLNKTLFRQDILRLLRLLLERYRLIVLLILSNYFSCFYRSCRLNLATINELYVLRDQQGSDFCVLAIFSVDRSPPAQRTP
jgi:hypothetical protein